MFQHEISQSTVYQCNFIHILARHFQVCSGVQTRFSLVPRSSKIGEGEGLVYTVCACALMSSTPSENIILLYMYSSVLPLRMMTNGYLLTRERVCVMKSCHSSWTINMEW